MAAPTISLTAPDNLTYAAGNSDVDVFQNVVIDSVDTFEFFGIHQQRFRDVDIAVTGIKAGDYLIIDGDKIDITSDHLGGGTYNLGDNIRVSVDYSSGAATVRVYYSGNVFTAFDGIIESKMNSIVEGLKFGNDLANPEAGVRTIRVSALEDMGSEPNDAVLTGLDLSTSITVAPVNQPPSGAPTTLPTTGTEDTAFTLTADHLTVGVIEPDGDTLSVVGVITATNGTVVDNLDGTYTVTPDANFNGTMNLSYTLNDGNGHDLAVSQNVEIAPVNDTPVVATPIDDIAAIAGAPFSFVIPGSTFEDIDSFPLTISASGLPAWLTFDAITNTFSGTPGNADSGVFSVTVTASDGELSASDTFDIVVTAGANPVASLSSNTVAENSPKNTEIGTFSGVDADGDALTYALGAGDPDNAAFAIVDGKLVVAKGAGLDFETKNEYEITVTVSDNDGNSFDQSFVIDVTDVAENPKGTKKNDKLEGDAMDNVLNGKKGNDKLTGNDGADTFMFSKGKDKVLDFDGLEGDMIDLSKAKGIKDFDDLMANHVKDTDAGFKIIDDKGDSMFLKGIDADDLTADMFMF